MIGIVIVSHSRRLAEGLKELAEAMSQVQVPIAAAGGVDDPEHPLGTDGMRVLEAIREVLSDEGALVFADIGSARLSAEMAIELLEADEQAKVHFCEAPLVEGVLAAAVQIAAGSDSIAVMREARQAGAMLAETPEATGGGVEREFTIRNRLGLHARPAALLVRTMGAFEGDIRLENLSRGKQPVSAKSINGIMLSDVSGGDSVRLTAPADKAEAVFTAMQRLIDDNFGDPEDAAVESASSSASAEEMAILPQTKAGALVGVAIAPGFALGPLHHVQQALLKIEPVKVEDPAVEIERLDRALIDAEAELNTLLQNPDISLGDAERQIFMAHITYLHDQEIITEVRERIRRESICAAAIWQQTLSALADRYAALEDRLLQARAIDVIDVGQRVLRFLTDARTAPRYPTEPAVLAFQELHPSDVAALADSPALGICTAYGGKTSHAGILASGLSIPVIFSLGEALNAVPEGQQVMLDGGAARLLQAPDSEAVAAMEQARLDWQARRNEAEAARLLTAETRDGHRVQVAANMTSADELPMIAHSGAEEIGLLRTEFLYMGRDTAPDEEEQYEIYRRIVRGLEGRPLTIRTADIGGDKPVPYMKRPKEMNPNLGWRGLRYSLDEPALFETQLAAILRASADGPVRIMFPMVSTLSETRAARERVNKVMERLRRAGKPFDEQLQIGIMIEVPAAVELAPRLASEVDFFSIGTNDLTQYVMAADRANPKLQKLSDPFHPAVLRMIARTIEAAHEANIRVGMCGAMAGNPQAIPILVGLGLDEFSMPARDIAEFKLVTRRLSHSTCRLLATAVIRLDSSKAVHERVMSFLAQLEKDTSAS